MELKLKMECMSCHCLSELNSKSFYPNADLTCPNCGNVLLREYRSKIVDLMNAAKKVSDIMPGERDSVSTEGFRLI